MLKPDHTWTTVGPADSSASVPPETGPSGTPAVSPSGRGAAETGLTEESAGEKKGLFAGIDRSLILIGGTVLGFLILVILGLILFFSIIQPAKKRKPLLQALRIIDQERRTEYTDAEDLLTKAITSGLKQNDLDEAYFARAYLRALRDDCSGTIEDLSRVNLSDPAVQYLDLWAKVKVEKYKYAYEIYDTNQDALQDFLKSKELMSIACFNLGKEHWKKREIKEAVQYFDRVRSLGVHADRVPGSISDHQVTLGIVSLFNKEFLQAREYFEAAEARATQEKRSTMNAEIGLLLCRWCSGERSQLRKPLMGIVQKLEKDYGDPQSQKAKTGKSGGDEYAGEGERKLDDKDLLIRNVLLWHAVSLIHEWCEKDEKSGLTPAERDSLRDRLNKVMAIDSEMPDPKLIQGLVDYFFFHNALREESLDMLEKSSSLVPEVDLIIKRERKLDELQKDSIKTYFSIVNNYLDNKSVPQVLKEELKEKLIHRLEAFPHFRHLLGEMITEDQATSGEGPTIQNLSTRQEFIRKRMGAIIGAIKAGASKDPAGKGKKAEEELEKSMKEISENTQRIKDTYDQVEAKVNRVLVYTGEVLLPEEEDEKEGILTPEPAEILLLEAGPPAKTRRIKPAAPKETRKKR